jgi:HPt (histidine-containing phosphotransfer) domain-containing protein
VLDAAHLERLREALGGPRIAALIAGLPDDARPHRERLAAPDATRDLDHTRRAAHALKGIAANLGLRALAELTGEIEEACAEGGGERTAELCERVEAVWLESYARLREVP